MILVKHKRGKYVRRVHEFLWAHRFTHDHQEFGSMALLQT